MTEKPRATDAGAGGLEHRDLRSALEFVVTMAEELQRRRPPPDYPRGLKPFFGGRRIPSASLGKLRRIVEGDPAFREAMAQGALPELVDEIGRLWLQRPPAWEVRVDELATDARVQQLDASQEAQLRRAERRRASAEQATLRAQSDVLQLTRALDDLRGVVDGMRSDLVKLGDERDGLRAELIDVRNEARHARDREAAAQSRLVAAERDREQAADLAHRAESVRDDALATRAEAAATVADVESALHAARSLANQLEALLPSESLVTEARPATRVPLSLPGGVVSGSFEAADHLAHSDAALLIDGYNVTKLQWPNRSLEEQRNLLLDRVEDLAKRFGTDVTVVFDGASVVGAHAARRRLVRVVYSPEGVIADDVIRDEVRRLPTSRPVVVVTNDREIIRDVRAAGANTVPSNAFLAIL